MFSVFKQYLDAFFYIYAEAPKLFDLIKNNTRLYTLVCCSNKQTRWGSPFDKKTDLPGEASILFLNRPLCNPPIYIVITSEPTMGFQNPVEFRMLSMRVTFFQIDSIICLSVTAFQIFWRKITAHSLT